MNERNLILQTGRFYEWLIDADTGEILCEGHKLSAADVLFALGYNFEVNDVKED